MFKILIGSDIVPTPVNIDLFEAGDDKALVGEELVDKLKEADFRVFNLETPICDKEDPIIKCGPNLIAPTRTMPGIKALNPSLMALANNHILDQGDQGLFETIEQLKMWNIPYMGVGENLQEAQKPYIIEADGKRIGVYNCAEHEFTIATDDKAGANPFDVFESLDHIADLKAKCDFVIVLYHGGKEYNPYPSPYLRKVCRKIAEKGADLVICQHTHCIGCQEEHNGGIIVYGQGNFLFNKKSNYPCWYTSILVEVEFTNKMKVDYIPTYIYENGIRLAKGEKAKEIIDAFYMRSKEILQKALSKKNSVNLLMS